MISLLIAAGVGLLVSIFGTPYAIRYFRRREIGQFIQEEIAGMHGHKQGTPTMGGVVFVTAAIIGYFVSHIRVVQSSGGLAFEFQPLSEGGLLAVFALSGMAVVGLLDDWTKYSNKRSLGLSKSAKFGGQLAIAALFAWGASMAGVVTEISFVRPLGIDLGPFFVIWVLIMLTGAANGVNLADGMDGLAGGSSALVVASYTVIAFWQFRNQPPFRVPGVYEAVDPLELAIISAAMFGAILGFLWWNAPPAKIIMGDVGSQAIGGLLAALALLAIITYLYKNRKSVILYVIPMAFMFITTLYAMIHQLVEFIRNQDTALVIVTVIILGLALWLVFEAALAHFKARVNRNRVSA